MKRYGKTKYHAKDLREQQKSSRIPEENPVLELKVLVLNINRGNNEELTEKCKTLKEYMLYIERIRYYIDVEKKSLQDAVETAVDECIREGILADFLRKNKAEAIAVSIFEYDEEKELKLLRESEREYGIELGLSIVVKSLKKCRCLLRIFMKKLFLMKNIKI